MLKSLSSLLVLAYFLIPVSSVLADAIVVTKAMSATTIAEVFVEDGQVRIELEIGAADVPAFVRMQPDQVPQSTHAEVEKSKQLSLRDLFVQGITIEADGQKLVGKIAKLVPRKRVVRDQVTGKPRLLQPEDAEDVVYAELTFGFHGQPKTIAIAPLAEQEENVRANIGFVTYHRNLPVNNFRYLSRSEVLDLDWDDPWYSRFRNRNLKRQFDSPLNVFLYVEPFEVRVEIVARPVDIQRWTELNVDANATIPVEQQAGIKKRVAEFLSDKVDVQIDGQPRTATFDRIHFISRTLRKTGVVFPDQELHASSATLGVIFVIPIEHLPEVVSLRWSLFDERIKEIPAVATDEAGGLPSIVTAEEPIVEWKNYLTNPTVPAMLAISPPPQAPTKSLPIISIMLIGGSLAIAKLMSRAAKSRTTIGIVIVFGAICATVCLPYGRWELSIPFSQSESINEREAQQITGSLLHNLYRSFDRKEESVVYDRLATSISGDLLREVYLQMIRRIRLEDQGGAQVKIDDIEVLSNQIEMQDDAGFRSKVEWNVVGTVGHWGHLHSRANQYVADFDVRPLDGAWKITAMEIIDEVALGVSSQ